ncbi:hypothetical protein BpHYR1_050110 [Brachionus plicatilis]|uniref:Uncharacterized protein n=1 Tax=Brachionus plicatilis TaxID=10195 RepID=A0A3M7RB84_BRAPC|nr:hypothetical protein BpHYR1_050110 [Brachionus plicatilis]
MSSIILSFCYSLSESKKFETSCHYFIKRVNCIVFFFCNYLEHPLIFPLRMIAEFDVEKYLIDGAQPAIEFFKNASLRSISSGLYALRS